MPKGVTLLSDLDLAVVSVGTPTVVEEPEAEVAEGELVAEGEAAPEAGDEAAGEDSAESATKKGGE